MTTKTSSSRGAKHGHFTKGKSRRKHRYITPLTNAALTEALSTPKAGASGKFRYDMPSGTVVISSHATEKPPAKGTLYGYIVKGSGGWKPVTLSRGGLTGRKPDNTGKQLFDVSKPLAERLRILGAKPGDKLDDAKVARILRSMRTGAEQVTGSAATAKSLLENSNFDGTGLTAEQLVRDGRAGRVLSRLDDLRYGARD